MRVRVCVCVQCMFMIGDVLNWFSEVDVDTGPRAVA